MNRIFKALLAIGPGIFAIGYTIGTGSVTSMIVAGSSYGMQLLWVLFLSCLFSWVMMEAYGRYAIVTGETALFGFRQHLRFGKIACYLIIIGVVFGQWNSLIGILGISSNVIFETLNLFFPALEQYQYTLVLVIAVIIIVVMNVLLWVGKYNFFEKVLIFFVTIMGISFLFSLFVVLPPTKEILKGMLPSIPQVEGGRMLVAAFVGTTMAAATFLSRPLFIKGKGWGMDHMRNQKRDAMSAALLIFFISGAIMAVSMGAMYYQGQTVDKALDMVYALEPVAGKFAIAIFLLGTMSAGLSSIFPIMMIAPMLIADFQSGKLDTKSTQFRVLVIIASIIGLIVPILDANPVQAQILTQVFNVFVLPLVIVGIMILVNSKRLMGAYRAGIILNVGMAAAFVFSCVISYNGVLGVIQYFQN
ncbi:MAG: Nramp family divalent metal transporter [Cyclobacteriaceae bacterium]|nr:Nramp family divalent metal transporter [Cyclobacteriaceae bacterium]